VRLSVCIPTHHGRRRELAVAVRSVLDQGRPDVEVCVSDNASADGTRALMEELARAHPGRVAYRRHREDRGAGANVLAAVELARGDWCWLLGSDDALREGALETVLARLDAEPGLAGLTVGRATMDRTLAVELPPEPDAVLPDDPERDRTFTDPEEALAQLGVLFTYLSAQVVRRDAWRTALAAAPPRLTSAHPLYPHTAVLARVVLHGGAPWAWAPRKLVRNRGGNQAIGEVAADELASTARCAREFCGVWPPLLGRRHPVTAGLRERARRLWADPVWLDRARTGPAGAARFALGLAPALWPLPAYWRSTLPRLALGPRAGPPMDALPPGDMRARIAVDLPATAEPGARLQRPCTVVNHGSVPWRSTAPHPVHLAVRWRRDDPDPGPGPDPGPEPERIALPGPIAPGAGARITMRTNVPWTPGAYRLSVELVQEQVAWFADVDPASCASATVRVIDEPRH